MEYIAKLTLDLNTRPKPIRIAAKQGDAIYRLIEISLTRDGTAYVPDGVTSYMFRCSKPDGNVVILESDGSQEPIVKENGKFTITLSGQCLTVAGKCICDFCMLDAEENILSTINFKLCVMEMPPVYTLTSSTEWQRLLNAIAHAETIGEDIHFRVHNHMVQYSTDDGETWEDMTPVSEIIGSAGEIPYSFTDTYPDDTVGKELQSLKNEKANKATKVNGKSLNEDITVNAGDVPYDSEASYDNDTVGKEVHELNTRTEAITTAEIDALWP